jgi:predicted small secreted protein
MKKIFSLLFFIVFLVGFSQKKINGISFVASNREIVDSAIQPVIAVNANWITLMPFAFMKTKNDTSIVYNDKHQWLGERKEGIEKTAKAFHEKKIKIMLKPQIWVGAGDFTGNITMKSDKNWILLERNYENFILFYAKIAENTNCEMFCIGTELNSFVVARPDFWKKLITKIRAVYKGEITYAENWDTFDKVSFLSNLDYIGVDAYFPLCDKKTATIKELVAAWKPYKASLKSLSEKYNKKIIFTEFGYQSKDFTSKEPWKHEEKLNVNLIAQQNALAVVLANFWKENWFAGGFLWKWYDNHNQVGGIDDSDYTVQNKPAEKILAKFYKK